MVVLCVDVLTVYLRMYVHTSIATPDFFFWPSPYLSQILSKR